MALRTFIIIGLFISFTSYAQKFDFRNLSWGATITTVKETEKCNIVSEDANRIIYDCPLGGNNGKVVYTFTSSGKLMRAKYLVTPEYFNMVYYIRDYRLYLELLTAKYGNPSQVSPRVIAKQTIKEDEWAAYLSVGDLFVESQWTTPKTEIRLTLSKVGTHPAVQIDYISIEYDKLDMQEKMKQIAKDL